MKKKVVSICIVIIIFFQSVTLAVEINKNNEDEESENLDKIIETASVINENELRLNVRNAVVVDRKSNRVILGKQENKRVAMASTTKIMTAIVTVENANLNDEVLVSGKAAGIGGSRLGLKKGDKISVKDLLYGLMLCSGNDAAIAIAEHVAGSEKDFVDMMNKKVDTLNLKNTHFVTPHGLDDPDHYTTAYELAKLTNYAMENEIFSKIVGTINYTVLINGYPKNIKNTEYDKIIDDQDKSEGDNENKMEENIEQDNNIIQDNENKKHSTEESNEKEEANEVNIVNTKRSYELDDINPSTGDNIMEIFIILIISVIIFLKMTNLKNKKNK